MAASRTFRFPFEPVLRQRRQAEEEKQRALAEVLRRQLNIEDRLRGIQDQITDGQQQLGGYLKGGVNTQVIRAQASMTMQLDLQARRFALELAEVYRLAEAARSELLAASKERKSIERLRERRFEDWRLELNRQEAKDADDLTTTRLANRGDLVL